MQLSTRRGRALIYILIFLSGVAGLIYQVVWHKYLSILLGAQAKATAIVLAIFLGGISAGYHVFGQWTRTKRWNLLQTYALVELGLAAWAFLFPWLFRLALPLTSSLYASVGVGSLWIDVFVATLLIGLPTFLMGGTLPLLTQGLSEDLAQASGTHARIYGWNTVGACVGSLLAGYILIPMTDLPMTVTIGGALNILVAVSTWYFFAKGSKPQEISIEASTAGGWRPPLGMQGALLFAVAFSSGLYVLTLETVLIRLVGLSTGSSNYNFSLIVSIFVLGLGLGSLFARRISSYTPYRLFWNQVGVAVFLYALFLTSYAWPYWVHLVRIIFRDSPENFYLYQAALGVFLLALLAVPIGFCGLTLPLCFHLLKDRKETLGFRVGQLYGLNTVGCVLGALLGGYVLFTFFNLDQLFKLCVLAGVVSAGLAGWYCTVGNLPSRTQVSIGSAVLTMVLAGVLVAPNYGHENFVQPFRHQSPIQGVSYEGMKAFGEYLGSSTEYIFYKDGPNTSVGVGRTMIDNEERSRTIFVNGKSDGNTKGDFFTMNLTGHFPGLLARKLDHVAVVGFGTGITTGALAMYKETGRIDVVEIADTVIEAAPYFNDYNGGVTRNPKVHFNVMDAFRFLGASHESFDVIVSEPSNPWVAGVENLYSDYFYETVKRKLADDGLFMQWVQAYSFDDELLKTVLKTITTHFPYAAAFQMLEHDMALIASKKPITKADLVRAEARMAANPAAKRSLGESGITRIETLLALELMPSSLTPLLAEDAKEHRLEAPRLSHAAARAFFAGTQANPHTFRRTLKEFYPAVEQSLLSIYLDGKSPSREVSEAFRQAFCDHKHAKSRVLCEESVVMGKWDYPIAPFEVVYEGTIPKSDFRDLASFQPSPPMKKFNWDDFKTTQQMFDLYKKYYSAVARIPVSPVVNRLEDCMKTVPQKDDLYGECLLQLGAVLEIADPTSPRFKEAIHQFGDWFTTLSPQSQTYPRFKKAARILERLKGELDPKPKG